MGRAGAETARQARLALDSGKDAQSRFAWLLNGPLRLSGLLG